MTDYQLLRYSDPDELVRSICVQLADYISQKVTHQNEVHLALTGGRVGTQITKYLLANPIMDSPLVHIWWSDERFVSAGDNERNDSVVPQVFTFRTKLHRMPSTDTTSDLVEAVSKAQSDLHLHTTTRFCDRNVMMDICLLSVGPDGHVASLFPNHEALSSSAGIAGIADSPKPPPERLTWTLSTINASEQIWLIAAGSEKAGIVEQLLSGDQTETKQIPATLVRGKLITKLFTT